MTRFIQQQIPPTPTRSVPEAPCHACPASALVGSPDKNPVQHVAVTQQPEESLTEKKKKL